MLTVGVEEEFLLLDPGGDVAPVAEEVVRVVGGDARLKAEFMTYQLETTSGVFTRTGDLLADLNRLRSRAVLAAERVGARLVASGLPPFPADRPGMVTREPRYLELARRFPQVVPVGGACACQVHVGIPSRELGVQVLARLRPWLSTLFVLTVNSPIHRGADTGWESQRYRSLLQWPTFRPPGHWSSVEEYDETVAALIAHGAANDSRSVYLLARLSPRYPTVEVRVGDTCLTAEDTVLYATLVRALVATLVEDVREGRPVEPVTRAWVHASLLCAARSGIREPTTRLLGGGGIAFRALLAHLQEKVRPALEAHGDVETVRRGLERFSRIGTGSQRQRALWTATGDRRAFVAALSEATAAVATPTSPEAMSTDATPVPRTTAPAPSVAVTAGSTP